MNITFRPNRREAVVTFLVLAAILSLFILSAIEKRIWFFVVSFAGILIVGFFKRVVPAWRTWITVDHATLSGCTSNKTFSVFWADIISVRRFQTLLNVTTANEDLHIQLRELAETDIEQLWEAIQSHVHPSALEEDAYEQSPQQQAWVVKREKLVKDTALSFRLSAPLPFWRLILLLCFAFLIGTAVWSWLTWEKSFALFLLGFAGLSIPITLSFCSLILDSEQISIVTRKRRQQIYWYEVEHIKINMYGTPMIFEGNGKSVSGGPAIWPGETGKCMRELVQAEIEVRNITTEFIPAPPQPTPLAKAADSDTATTEQERRDRAELRRRIVKPLYGRRHWILRLSTTLVAIVYTWAIVPIHPNSLDFGVGSERFFAILFVAIWGSGILASLIFAFETVRVDKETITQIIFAYRRSIRWENVMWVNYSHRWLGFHSDSGKVVVTGPEAWSGKHKELLSEYILAQIEHYNIEIRTPQRSTE
ncbi:MAG TPA: hypothetical protein PKZ84_20250 [Anaerolineae bacterium]|nr:hypothetical protein [Anaerolineae bacterium]HQI86961.1 hypothetical protein [Anaerolineae bacterium]